MAKLLRLHLTSVGHKDARFFPLMLDFRDRDGLPTDVVVWLMNGGGKSSLMNLFYSSFLPETRKFLGEGARRRAEVGTLCKGKGLRCDSVGMANATRRQSVLDNTHRWPSPSLERRRRNSQ